MLARSGVRAARARASAALPVTVKGSLLLLAVLSAVRAAASGEPGAGLAVHHHPIATRSAEAQRLFDEGFTLLFAFNHDEAVRAFRRAAELAPESPMPHWGVALALGPNINLDVDPERERAAYEAGQRARALARAAPRNERDYVEALVMRYSIEPGADLKRLAADYSRAMGDLARRYPDDLDAATLYAESLMDLRPWHLWAADGTPAEGTEEIVAVLESVLARDPAHVGANHYYIHAVEASPHPERALPSARRLETLVPEAGHLVHMPAHIYMRVGDYAAAARSNDLAAQVDRAYIERTGVTGIYPLMYYSHNLHFLSAAYAMEGRLADARRAAEQLVDNVRASVKEMPMVEFAMLTPTLVDERFARWGAVLEAPEPDPELPITRCLWHFARGVAYAATGRVAPAEAERSAFAAAQEGVPADAVYGGGGLNGARTVMHLAGLVLDGRIAAARGRKKEAIDDLRRAVDAEDALAYDEPPAWHHPVRESLGGLLLRDRQYGEAERVFRQDLQRHPRNPRSLFGLRASLEGQGRTADATWVRRAFDEAWRNAEVPLRVEDL